MAETRSKGKSERAKGSAGIGLKNQVRGGADEEENRGLTMLWEKT